MLNAKQRAYRSHYAHPARLPRRLNRPASTNRLPAEHGLWPGGFLVARERERLTRRTVCAGGGGGGCHGPPTHRKRALSPASVTTPCRHAPALTPPMAAGAPALIYGRDLSRNPNVVIREVEVTSDGWHVLRRTTFDYRHADGRWETQQRETYDRGNGATILLYDSHGGRCC